YYLLQCNRVLWVGFVPFSNQFVAGLADVFAVVDRACEHTWDVQAVAQRGVWTIADRQVAIQVDAGREGSEPIHLDSATGAVEFDDLVAHFLDALVQRAFDDARGA